MKVALKLSIEVFVMSLWIKVENFYVLYRIIYLRNTSDQENCFFSGWEPGVYKTVCYLRASLKLPKINLIFTQESNLSGTAIAGRRSRESVMN